MVRNRASAIGIPVNGIMSSLLAMGFGIGYFGVGVTQLLVSVGLLIPIAGFMDIPGGFLLLVVAAVFLTGVKPLSRNEQEGYAFIIVGYILAAILFFLQSMVILTNGLGWMLGYEDWAGWDICNDITPSLWMFIILMTATGSIWIARSLRNKLATTMREVSSE